MNFSVKNCRVSVSFYFFALLCAAAFFDRSGTMLWGLLAALLHECGHLAAMFFIPGHAPREVSFTPFGIKISNSSLSEFAGGNGTVLAAGSVTNFLSAALTFGFLPAFAGVSAVLGLLNILPVEGMDGGGILRLWLQRHMPESNAHRVVRRVSWATIVVLGLSGLTILLDTGYNFTLLGAAAALALAGMKKRTGED